MQQQQPQLIKQQKHLHSGTVHPWTRGKFQKDIQQIGDLSAFQSEYHYPNPSQGHQEQGQQTSKKWGHIQV